MKTGSILFKEKEITNKPAHATTLLGMAHVPEGRRIFSGLTVKENLLMGAFSVKEKNVIEERMETAFELFPILKKRIDQKGGTMSGGEQQMLAIARALNDEAGAINVGRAFNGISPNHCRTNF